MVVMFKFVNDLVGAAVMLALGGLYVAFLVRLAIDLLKD
jgi:hypothetical protein